MKRLLCFIFLIFTIIRSGSITLSAENQNTRKGVVRVEEVTATEAADLDLEGIIMATTLGGLQDSTPTTNNNNDIDSLARFAVDEHNKKENALLELARVVKAQEQVVAGTLHHLTLEIIDAGEKKLYEAKVWVKPWMNFKELQEFKHAGNSPSITPADLGAKKGGPPSGWQSVPVHDPVVQDAANHAIKTIQQRSNSLLPYELQEIVHAKAEVIEELAKFDLLLKVKRGGKEEKYKVEVHKKDEGDFHLNHMVVDNA